MFGLVGLVLNDTVHGIVVINYWFKRFHRVGVTLNVVVDSLIGGLIVTISPSSVTIGKGPVSDFKNFSRSLSKTVFSSHKAFKVV
jgi:hypothetical protein